MKKQIDRIVLVAHICISALFVIIAVLTFSNVLALNIVEGVLVVDGYLLTIVLFMAFLYVITSLYLIISAFNDNTYLKQVLLYNDQLSQTNINMASLKKIAVNQCRQVGGLKLKTLRITLTESKKLRMIVDVKAHSDNVTTEVDTLRCLLTDAYYQLLSLKFDMIDINIQHLSTKYRADLNKANKEAQELLANRAITDELFENPIEDSYNEQEVTVITSTSDLKQSEPTTAETVVAGEEVEQFGTPHRDLTEDIVVEIADENEDEANNENASEETNENSSEDATNSGVGDGSSQDHMQVDIEKKPKTTRKKKK